MSIAGLVVGPIAALRRWEEIRRLTVVETLCAAAAGVLLALHFAFWISSLDDTSVTSSVVFVSTSPIFVGVASVFLLRERMGIPTTIGIVVSIVGAALLAIAFLSQVPSGLRLAGGLCILAGILLAARGESLGKDAPEKLTRAM